MGASAANAEMRVVASGTWLSHVNGHTGKLRAIITRASQAGASDIKDRAETLYAEAKKKLGKDKENQETFTRVTQHLTENKVDLETAKFGLGPALKLDGKNEVFIGELADKANPMLTREYRAPYVVPDEANL